MTEASTPAVHITALDAPANAGGPERTAVFLHGILGSGGNWRSFARRLQREVAERVALRVLLVDLPGHGDSPASAAFKTPSDATVDGCARAVLRALGLGGQGCDVLVGHSFGGKVALSMLAALRPDAVTVTDTNTDTVTAIAPATATAPRRLPTAIWILDSPPGATPVQPGSRRADVERVIDTLRAVPPPFASREDVVERLTAAGLSLPLSRWMTTNVARRAAQGGAARADGADPSGDGLWWRFDLDTVQALLDDYRQLDRWPLLDGMAQATKPPARRVHLVRAARSDRWQGADAERFTQLAGGGSEQAAVVAHLLPEAGHWLHVDAPDALRALIASQTPLAP